jgi:hypothetical protein
MHETGTGQEVAQLHDRFMMVIIIIIIIISKSVVFIPVYDRWKK